MEIEKTTKLGLLYDYYGQLFTDKQRQAFELYYEDDLSLAEIAEEIGVSRQAVHDSLKKTAALLYEYEKKLCLYAEYSRRNQLVEKIFRELESDNNKDKIETYLREIGA